MEIRRFFVPECAVEKDRIILDGEEFNHAVRVLRYKKGYKAVVSAGDGVRANIPFARSDGENTVSVAMYDGDSVISGYTLEGALPVWNS